MIVSQINAQKVITTADFKQISITLLIGAYPSLHFQLMYIKLFKTLIQTKHMGMTISVFGN